MSGSVMGPAFPYSLWERQGEGPKQMQLRICCRIMTSYLALAGLHGFYKQA